MTRIRLGTVVPILILLLSILACGRFGGSSNGPKPTQIVDLPSFIGKSREEITKMVGSPPSKDGITDTDWELPEGTLTVHKENGKTDHITYLLKKPESGFATSPEMAALANIDVKTRKVNEGRGLQSYDDISVNGNTFDLTLDNWGGRYVLARMTNIRNGGGVPEGFKPTQVVDLPAMIGKSHQEITKMVGISPYKDESTYGRWGLSEGRLAVEGSSYFSYNLKSYSDFDPDRGVASPEEMAKLVNIDTQGRQPEKIRDDSVAYRNLNVNGKTLDLYIKTSDTRYIGAWIENFNN